MKNKGTGIDYNMTEKKRTWMGAGCLAFGAVLILMGIARTEPATVLMKAITICMECIGIG